MPSRTALSSQPLRPDHAVVPTLQVGKRRGDATPKRSQEGGREGALLPRLRDARRQVVRDAMAEGGVTRQSPGLQISVTERTCTYRRLGLGNVFLGNLLVVLRGRWSSYIKYLCAKLLRAKISTGKFLACGSNTCLQKCAMTKAVKV